MSSLWGARARQHRIFRPKKTSRNEEEKRTPAPLATDASNESSFRAKIRPMQKLTKSEKVKEGQGKLPNWDGVGNLFFLYK